MKTPRFLRPAFAVALLVTLPVSAQEISRREGPPPTPRPGTDPYVPNPSEHHRVYPDTSLRPSPLAFANARFHGDSFGPYFLPPLPPVLGESLQRVPPRAPALPPHTTTPAPETLYYTEKPAFVVPADHLPYSETIADHVGEIYSVPLSYLFVASHYQHNRSIVLSGRWQADYSQLPRATRERLSRYLRDRRAAVESLRTKLAEIETAPADQRLALRTTFAAEQTPSLLALESDAEAIRADLTDNGFMKNPALDIRAVRPERARDAAQRKAQQTVIDVLSAAQFQSGLSLEQRLLLNEVTLDLALSFSPPAQSALFFSPAGARIRLPETLPPSVAQDLSAFQSLKTELKKELVDTVERESARILPGERTAAYTRLALNQADRFQRLESLAEEIRPHLVELPAFAAPEKSPLPPDLARRLAEAGQAKIDLHREVAHQQEEFSRDLPDHHVELVRIRKALQLSATPASDRQLSPDANRSAALFRMERINQDFARRFTALDLTYAQLRHELHAYQTSHPADSGVTIETLLTGFAQDYAAQENFNRYRDYRAAILLPGLSPAQRRLLFNAAQVALFKESRQISP